MMTLPDLKQGPFDLSDRIVTLNLTLRDNSTVTFRSCEVLGRGFRNRVSFSELRDVEDVLVERLAQAVKTCVNGLPCGAHVLALPDFVVELPGLALRGVHLMVMEAKEGARNAIFRFTSFVGAINKAFCADIGFEEPVARPSEKLAVDILAEICLPILNLCRSFETLSFGEDQRASFDFADKAREFEFQTELLKRFIFNAGTGHAEGPSGVLEQPTSNAALNSIPQDVPIRTIMDARSF